LSVDIVLIELSCKHFGMAPNLKFVDKISRQNVGGICFVKQRRIKYETDVVDVCFRRNLHMYISHRIS
jgi:hypothetical protein